MLYNACVMHWEYPYLSNAPACTIVRADLECMENGVSDRSRWVYVSVCFCEKDKESVTFCSLVCCFVMLFSLYWTGVIFVCL